MIKTSRTVTYLFLHLSLPYAILTNGTQDAKQCPVGGHCVAHVSRTSEN